MNMKHFFHPAWWFSWTVAGRGARDAALDYPNDSDFQDNCAEGRGETSVILSHYEAELVDIAETEISNLLKKWETTKHRIESDAKKIRHQFDEILNDLTANNKNHARRDFAQLRILFPKWLYIPIMLSLAVFEFPFNMEAFTILDLPKLEQVLLALGPSLGIPFLAHFLGTKIRQWPNDNSDWRPRFIIIFTTLILTLALLAIGYLRADYISYSQNPDAYEAGKAVINWNHAFALVLINFLFLALGTVAAYFSHDPDWELDHIVTSKLNLRKRQNKIWVKWSKVASTYDKQRGVLIQSINGIYDDTRAKLNEYRDYNSRYRPRGDLPKAFRTKITNEIFISRDEDLGAEIDLTPPAIDSLLENFERLNTNTDTSIVTTKS